MLRKLFLSILFIIPLFIQAQTSATVPYRIRMADSTYTVQLRGVTGTRTAGITISGIYSNTFKSHQFLVNKDGMYELWFDAAGGTNYSKDTGWSGTSGKYIQTQYFSDTIDSDYDYKVDAIDDSIITLSNMTQATIDYIGSGGNVTNNPDDIWTEANVSSQITLTDTVKNTVRKMTGDPTLTGLDSVGVYEHISSMKVYNVKDYGAVGDGVTNDTDAIQAAIDAANANNGILDLSRAILLTDTLNFNNMSDLIIRNGTLKLNSSSELIIYANNSDNITFIDVQLDADTSGTRWAQLKGCDNIKFNKCIFKNLGDGSENIFGLWYRNCDELTIYKCNFINANGLNVARFIMMSDTASIPSQNTKIMDNHFENIQPRTDGDAIYFEANTDHIGQRDINAIITNNSFVDCAKRYMKFNCDGVIITNNMGQSVSLGDSMFACISIYGSKFIISNNQFKCPNTAGLSYGIEIGTASYISEDIAIINNIIDAGKALSGSICFYLVSEAKNITIERNKINYFDYVVRNSFLGKLPVYRADIMNNKFENITNYGLLFYGRTYDLDIYKNVSVDTTNSKYFIYLSADSVHERTFIEGNRHNHQLGVINNTSLCDVLKNNFLGNYKEKQVSDFTNNYKISYNARMVAVDTSARDTTWFDSMSGRIDQYTIRIVETQPITFYCPMPFIYNESNLGIDSLWITCEGDAATQIDSIEIIRNNYGYTPVVSCTDTNTVICTGSNQVATYNINQSTTKVHKSGYIAHDMMIKIYPNVNTYFEVYSIAVILTE